MSRILLLLSLVFLLVSAWFVYSQGLLGQLFNPSVVVLQTNQVVGESQRVQPTMIRALEMPVAQLAPGTIAFPRETAETEIARVLGEGRAMTSIEAEAFLTSANFGKTPEMWQVRVLQEFEEGAPLTLGDLDIVELDDPDLSGLSFRSRAAAESYIREQVGLRAAQDLTAGQVLSLQMLASGEGGTVYALETLAALSAGAPLTAADVRAITLSGGEIPRGAIAFPSQAGADIFVSASRGLAMAADVPAGSVLDATMIRSGAARRLRNVEELTAPETLDDLLALQREDPFAVKMINLAVNNPEVTVDLALPLVGSAPRENDTMDLWVETGRTTGPFAFITLRRFVSGISVEKVVDPELILASIQREEEVAGAEFSGATEPPVLDEPDDVRGVFYWANITRAGGLAMDEAKNDNRLVFAMSSKTPISDFLGNGVLCKGEYCTVSVDASSDLMAVRETIAAFQSVETDTVEDAVPPAPFRILDGVSPDIELSLHDQGYLTFENVAQWTDDQLQTIEFQLGVSRTLVLYIREQARTVVNMPTAARQQLSIATTPTE